MAVARWVPVIGLFVVLGMAPGVLGHHCLGEEPESEQPGQLFAQTVGTPPSALQIVAYVLIPIVGVLAAVGIAIPSMRSSAEATDARRFTR